MRECLACPYGALKNILDRLSAGAKVILASPKFLDLSAKTPKDESSLMLFFG
jgi:hypothetical protein